MVAGAFGCDLARGQLHARVRPRCPLCRRTPCCRSPLPVLVVVEEEAVLWADYQQGIEHYGQSSPASNLTMRPKGGSGEKSGKTNGPEKAPLWLGLAPV